MDIESNPVSGMNIDDIYPNDIIVIEGRRERYVARVWRVFGPDDIEVQLYFDGRFGSGSVTVGVSEIVQNVNAMTRVAL